jgi:hypothetical protein
MVLCAVLSQVCEVNDRCCRLTLIRPIIFVTDVDYNICDCR